MSYWVGFIIPVIWFISCIIVSYMDITMENPKEIIIIKDNSNIVTINPIKAIKNFRTEFWLLSIVFCLSISSVAPYINFSSEFLYKTKFAKMIDRHLAEKDSALFTGSCFIICAVLGPIMGIVQKKVGMRPYFLLLSTILALSSVILFYISPMIGIINLGISNSILMTVFWITMGFVVNKSEEVIIY